MTTMLREWQVNIPTLGQIQSEIENLRALIESLSVNVKLDSHSVTAQQDQIEVEFPFSYDENSLLIIFRNGLLQRAGEQYDYVPVSNNKVSFNVPLEEGDVVTIIHISSSGPVGDTIGGGNGGSGNIDEDLRNLITQTAINLAKTNFKLNTHMTATRERLSGLIIDVFNDTSGIDEELSRLWGYDPERKEIHVLTDQGLTDLVWEERFTENAPPARLKHSLTYDSARGVVVLFGGLGSSGRLNDTWEYDGTNWWQINTPTKPPARSGHSLTYDSTRGVVVLFGGTTGLGSSGRLNDTWEYDGTNWWQINTPTKPPARSGHSLTYDSARGVVVLFGGTTSGSSSGALNDTWEYDGTDWRQINTPTKPPARWYHSLTYDSARGVVVLFGGERYGSFGDTWEYDGTDWREINTPTKPPARTNHSLTYDSARGVVVLFGGLYGTNRFNDTWEYDGTDWREINTLTQPPARDQHSLTYDSDRGAVVLFGGTTNGSSSGALNDTWEYYGTDWVRINAPTRPPARSGHSLTYDSARGVVVLFGGDGSSGRFNDTWEYWYNIDPAEVVSSADILDSRPSYIYFVSHTPEGVSDASIQYQMSLDDGKTWFSVSPEEFIQVKSNINSSDPPIIRVKAIISPGGRLSGWAYGWV